MYETVTNPRPPNPIIVFQAPKGPTLGNWSLHKSRRMRECERFGDLQRHPWVGERQAGKAANQYYRQAHGVDKDIRGIPYDVRVLQPASGTYPLLIGLENGPGPHPWHEETDAYFLQHNYRGRSLKHLAHDPRAAGKRPPGDGGGHPYNVPIDKNLADYQTGPGYRGKYPAQFRSGEPLPFTPAKQAKGFLDRVADGMGVIDNYADQAVEYGAAFAGAKFGRAYGGEVGAAGGAALATGVVQKGLAVRNKIRRGTVSAIRKVLTRRRRRK